MSYTDYIDRTGAAPLIPVEVSKEILSDLAETNLLFQLARRMPDITSNKLRMPVLSSLPTAYFLDGDTDHKQTTSVEWANKFITAEELAVIVPVPIAVLEDAEYDIWGEIRPLLVDAFNIAITQAVLYGTNIPTSWITDLGNAAGIVALATARNHVAALSDFEDIYEAIMGEGDSDIGLIGLIEEDGYLPNGYISHVSVRSMLRNARTEKGDLIFTSRMQDAVSYYIDGEPIYFPRDGSIDKTEALMIAGDWTKLLYAFRQDINFTIDGSAVIQDAAGNIVFNAFQQDGVALRAVMRLGFALPNPVTYMNPNDSTRCPFAILTAGNGG